ncbi:PIN domain-containing protein [Mycolicibacterium elephantis]
MGATMVVLDTNQVRDFPMLESRDWDELIAKAAAWDLKFAVPEVCFYEAVRVVRRKWTNERTALKKFRARELDLDDEMQAILEKVDSKIDGYEEALKARLAEVGAEIVAIPSSLELFDVMLHAIDRRAPYTEESKRDGFRDTLIWYTTLSIAARDKDCDVWLVSANINDFGGDTDDQEACPYPLHPQLIEDLETANLSGRLSYVKTLGRLRQHLAATYEALPANERGALIEALRMDEFDSRLSSALVGEVLDKASVALPVKTLEGVLEYFVTTPDTLEFVDAAKRGGGTWTAQFHLKIEASVALLLDEGDTSSIEKTLMIAGRIEAGIDGNVRDLIVSSIEAMPGDPMRRAYLTRSDLAFPTADYAEWLKMIRPDYSEMLKNVRPDYSEMLKNMRLDYNEALKNVRPDYSEMLKNMRPDYSEMLKNMRLDYNEALKNVRPDYSEMLKNMRPDYTEILKNMRLDYNEMLKNIRPDYSEMLKNLRPDYNEFLKRIWSRSDDDASDSDDLPRQQEDDSEGDGEDAGDESPPTTTE